MDWEILSFQLLNLFLWITWITFFILAVRTVFLRKVPQVQQALWVLIALVVPVIGGLFCIIFARNHYPPLEA